jgi:diadenosine tetraphosphate (Ap4A) HIT family hydrolase
VTPAPWLLDLRQFNAGHVLVILRAHVADLREADGASC